MRFIAISPLSYGSAALLPLYQNLMTAVVNTKSLQPPSHQQNLKNTTKRHGEPISYLEKLWNLAPAHFTVHVGCPAKLRATVCRPRESRIARRPLPCLFDCHPPAAALAGKGNILISPSPRRFVSLSSMDFIKKKTESTGNPLRKDYFLSDHSIGGARDFYTDK